MLLRARVLTNAPKRLSTFRVAASTLRTTRAESKNMPVTRAVNTLDPYNARTDTARERIRFLALVAAWLGRVFVFLVLSPVVLLLLLVEVISRPAYPCKVNDFVDRWVAPPCH
jgi:hypothetical protein